ncbi:hypothetical protein ABB37_05740 [Leptomonas pyrrhocoris]|uniref:Uncharacterized protein n=1 Tax=Leptomonas pyrrhocoris TaxID=157538 RepID=A0A0M9FZG9_LEPPY|nr:hypothetical protein ABB37_05740 [Leptomonas pyrrhocoris]KPA79265.1 hypothetical protein ABB37_05740 [Leptomonas pyrrhocoris]|eukprot:XP_015657704.1 hypothetical protein ABB37_05740 [Leptomonas pyrrhocoris]
MSSIPRPYRVGGINVCCYHNCTQAAAIHAELKKLHIDAAVVDHAFILSPLQLAVAFFRVESNYDFVAPTNKTMGEGQQQQHETLQSSTTTDAVPTAAAALPGRRMSFSRRLFASLSLTHNLDRILQVLPPGPHTSSVVILYRSPRAASSNPTFSPVRVDPSSHSDSNLQDNSSAVELERSIESAIQQSVRSTNHTAAEHSFCNTSEPFWKSSAVQYADVSKLMEYYSVSEAMMMAAQHSLTRRDAQRVCSAAVDGSVEAQRQALRWHTLELCVTTQLAACTA